MNKKILIVLITILLVITGFTIHQLLQLNKFTVVSPQRGNINTYIIASGKTKAGQTANLSFKTNGKISFLIQKNQRVKKNQVVASLNKKSLKNQLKSALKDYYVARMEYEQLLDDYDNNLDSDTKKRNKEIKQAQLDKAVLAVELLKQQIDESSLYSPFDGLVTKVNGEINEWVSSFNTSPLVVIVNPNSIYFEAEVKEENIDKISVGQTVEIGLYAFSNKKFLGTVTEINKETRINKYGETIVPIKIEFNQKQSPTLIGLEGDIKIKIRTKKNVLVLPKRAVFLDKDQPYVKIKNNIFIINQPIKLGIEGLEKKEIINGLTEKSQVLMPKISP